MYISYFRVFFFLGGGVPFESVHLYGDVTITYEMCISSDIVVLRCCRSLRFYVHKNVIEKYYSRKKTTVDFPQEIASVSDCVSAQISVVNGCMHELELYVMCI